MVEDETRGEDTQTTSSMRCGYCEGEGYVYHEIAVVDYVNGGWLEERRERCEECQGEGVI
jgi:DnaJ-class molecular chaperone